MPEMTWLIALIVWGIWQLQRRRILVRAYGYIDGNQQRWYQLHSLVHDRTNSITSLHHRSEYHYYHKLLDNGHEHYHGARHCIMVI